MKKNIYFLCLLGLIYCSTNLRAQVPGIIISPTSQCFSAGGNTAVAYITPQIPGAVNYSWTVSSGSCIASVSTFSNGTVASISYPCCGVYSYSCVARDSSSAVIGGYFNTATVNCAPNISVSGNMSVCSGYTTTLFASGATSYTWITNQGTFNGSSIVLSPTATSCYSLVGSNGSGCNSYTTGCVTVISGTGTPIISGNFNTCNGSSTTLYASGASNYTWLPGGSTSTSIVVSPYVTSCYTLVGSSCSGIGSTVRCVTVGTTPFLSISGNPTICAGSSATLTASGASSYTWLTSIGNFTGSTVVLSPTATTCFSLAGSNGPGCMAYTGGCISVLSGGSPAISGNLNVCNGNPTTLYASGATNYTWLPGGSNNNYLVVSPSVTTCYTLTGQGCSGLGSTAVCVSVGISPTLSVSGNTSVCAGNPATLTATGANTYTWYVGMNTYTSSAVVFSPTATTCYSLIASNGMGCNSYYSACISVISANTPSINGIFNTCAGQPITLYATGGYNYTWTPGGSTSSSIVVTPNTTTCYTLSGIGCSGVGSTARCVTVNPTPVISVFGNTTVCAGYSTSLTASGAATYSWITNSTFTTGSTIVLTPTSATCYSVIGISNQGCIGGANGCITVTSGTGTPVISGNFNTCNGSSTTLYASGASNYTWLPGGSTSTYIVVSPSVTSCYTLVGSGCSGTGATVRCVTVGTTPFLSIAGNSTICAGNNATLTASGASSYTWLTSMGNFTGSTIVLSPTATTCFSLVGSNGPGCVAYSGSCVSVLSSGSPTISGNFNACNGNPTTLYASGATNYTWLPGGSNNPYLVVSPSVTTCYTVIGQGCSGLGTAIACVSVGTTPTLSVSGNNSICAGYSSTLTATGANTYTWYTGMGTFTSSSIVLSPTATTCYSLIASNSQGCNSYSSGCISVLNGSLNIFGNTSICSGSSTTLTASGAQSYTWLPGNLTGNSVVLSPTATTCYTVLGYTQPGCSGAGYVCVFVNSPPNIYTSSGFICSGQSGTLNAFGASSYTWQPFNQIGANIIITPTTSGCYTVTGTNSVGCTSSVAACYSVQPAPTLMIYGNNTSCAGAPSVLTASGSVNYTWYPGGITGSSVTVSPLSSTCYTVLSNSNGCIASAVKCLSVQSGPSITTSGNTSICNGGSTTLTANGASSYTWLPGNLTGSLVVVSPTASTCYTVVGTHSSGCVGLGYRCVQLTPVPTISITGGILCSGSPAVLQAFGASNYTWLPFGLTGSSISISPTVSTCYTVIGSNGSGCNSSASNCFSVLPTPTITVIGNSTICVGATATLSASGANSYLWLPVNLSGANVVVNPSVSTCYTVIGTNGNCTSSVIKCITVAPAAPLTISGNNIICSGTSANILASGANTYTWNTGSNSSFITVTPTTSTCYTVIGTNANGCIGSAVKCITVQTVPFINISGSGSICAGSNALLIASGASSYFWSTGSTSSVAIVSPSATTVYSVTGSNGICSATQSVSVLVNPKPTISIFRTDSISNDSIICAGNAVHLYVNGANTYTWSNGSTSQFISVSPNATTTYTVSGTNLFGCSNSNIITLYVSACTGLSKNNNSSTTQIEMYPNPSSGQFILKGDGLNKINYRVFDLLGKEVLKGELMGSKNIDLSNYANGTYIIRFEAGSVMTYKKLIIEK